MKTTYWNHLWKGALILMVSACAVVPEETSSPETHPELLPRHEIETYARMRDIVLNDGTQRWVITPQVVLEFTDGFLSFEYGSDEGLLGSVLSVTQDPQRLWIGTTRAVQSLDKSLHFVRTYIQEPDLHAVSLDRYGPDQCAAVTSRGVVFIDAASLGQEIYPLDGFAIREVNDVAYFEGDLWIATRRGLHRFSLTWKSWNQAYGSKMLQRLNVIRLEPIEERVGQQLVPVSLYAITASDLFIYRTGFDSWDRLGL